MPVTWNEENAAHLLRRAGFGPTAREIEDAVEDGMEATITGLLDARVASDRLGVREDTRLEELQAWWVRRMAKSKSPFHEKLTLFWHNHFATAYDKLQDAKLLHLQNQTLRALGLGPFRDLVRAIARDPAMILWLDNQTNTAADPNENFARELMELFTTGVYDAARSPNYTETDVQECARAFTGWFTDDYLFVFDAGEHDFGSKTFRGIAGNLDGDDVIENLVLDPATSRRLAWKLYAYFAHDVALDDPRLDPLVAAYAANDTAIRPMLDVLFRMDEFYAAEAKHARVKSPVEFLVGSVRMLGGKIRGGEDANFDLGATLRDLGQAVFDPPSVFGWDEGLAWTSSNGLLQRARLAERIADGRAPERPTVSWKITKLLGRKSEWLTLDAPAVVARVLAALGPVAAQPSTVAALETYLQTGDDGNPAPFAVDEFSIDKKVRGLVALVLSSPDYQLA